MAERIMGDRCGSPLCRGILIKEKSMKNIFINWQSGRFAAAAMLWGLLFSCTPENEVKDGDFKFEVSPLTLSFDWTEDEPQIVTINTNADSWDCTGQPEWMEIEKSTNFVYVWVEDNDGENAVTRPGTFRVVAVKDGVEKTAEVSFSQLAYGQTSVEGAIWFDDMNFKQWLIDAGLDLNQDGELVPEEVDYIEELDLTDLEEDQAMFTSLKGIEHFTALKHLDCNSHRIETLDLTGMSNLETLDCNRNRVLSSLVLDGCDALTHLNCGFNDLKILDFAGKCPNLTWLDCEGNKLTGLNLAGKSKLGYLSAGQNSITELVLKDCKNLLVVACFSNRLSALDLKDQTELLSLTFYGNAVNSIDLSANVKLGKLWCANNALTSLDLSGNPEINFFDCSDNYISSLEITGCDKLEEIVCANNRITALSLNPLALTLKKLDCSANRLETFEVSECSGMTALTCGNTGISTLDVSKMSVLESLVCNDNELTDLDVSANRALTALDARGNALTALWMYEGQTIPDLKIDDRSVIKTK